MPDTPQPDLAARMFAALVAKELEYRTAARTHPRSKVAKAAVEAASAMVDVAGNVRGWP